MFISEGRNLEGWKGLKDLVCHSWKRLNIKRGAVWGGERMKNEAGQKEDKIEER